MKMLIVAGYAESLIAFRGSLIQSMMEKKVRVSVVAPFDHKDVEIKKKLEDMGVGVHHVPLSRTGINPLKDILFSYHLWRLIREHKYDSVFAYTVKPVVYGMMVSRFIGVPRRYALITGLGYAFIGDAKGLRYVLRIIVFSMYSAALKSVNMTFFQNKDDELLFRTRGLIKQNASSCIVARS